MTNHFYLDLIIILALIAAIVWGWTAHCPTPHDYWPDLFPNAKQERRLQNRFRLLLALVLPLLCAACSWIVSLH
jgi:hypothetical protein